ncbi:polyhydroxybutyrate depolymerase [Streptomyces sp. NBC_01381]|uniref:alpha/beta hydrolase family esterase n=1 Tax=Streptomyces sp. NBC_01381 TaxID=2903845 RepID=UPI00224E4104|nr:PHB depolymerase family esterase [Streptomyces sp. NBC_01381]MCX4670436.1 polyhydroxybutyrate depolymerase [Streptomyces sp. NBC_01381]
MPTRRGKSMRYAIPATLIALLLPLGACGSDDEGSDKPDNAKPTKKKPAPKTPRPGDQKVALSCKGQKRVYSVHAPPGYTTGKQLPLIIAMHPYPGTGDSAAQITDLSKKADKENFLVAYPDGLNQGFNALVCCGTEDDVGFLRTMTKRLVGTWKADPERIYATGISNGGDMAYKLAVELPDTFAAIAPVSGGYIGPDTAQESYVPKTPVSLVTFIGGLDPHYADFDEGIKAWQKRLSCKAPPPQKLKKNITKTSAKCRDGSTTVTYRLPDMAHQWPGGAGTMADPEAGISATDLMWEFFKTQVRD